MGTALPSLRSDDRGNRRYLRAGTGAACGEIFTDRSRCHFSLSASGAVSAARLRQAVTKSTAIGQTKQRAQNLLRGNMMPPELELSGSRSALQCLVKLPDVERFGVRDFCH